MFPKVSGEENVLALYSVHGVSAGNKKEMDAPANSTPTSTGEMEKMPQQKGQSL